MTPVDCHESERTEEAQCPQCDARLETESEYCEEPAETGVQELRTWVIGSYIVTALGLALAVVPSLLPKIIPVNSAILENAQSLWRVGLVAAGFGFLVGAIAKAYLKYEHE